MLGEGIAVRQAMTISALHDEGPRVHADFVDGSRADYRRRRGRRRPALVGAHDAVWRTRSRLPWTGELALHRRRLLGGLDVDGVARARQGLPGRAAQRRPNLLLCRSRRRRAERPHRGEPVAASPSSSTGSLHPSRRSCRPASRRTSRPSKRCTASRGCAAGSRSWATQRTRCHRTWQKVPAWRSRTHSSSPTRSPPADRSRTLKPDGDLAWRSCEPRRTGETDPSSASRSQERGPPARRSPDLPERLHAATGRADRSLLTVPSGSRQCAGSVREVTPRGGGCSAHQSGKPNPERACCPAMRPFRPGRPLMLTSFWSAREQAAPVRG